MSGYWSNIALVVVLVIINAAFAGSEMALVSLRQGQLKQLERQGTRASLRLVALARDPNRYLATVQIGITLAGFLASAAAAVTLAEPVAPLLGFLGDAAEPAAVAGVTLVLTFFTLVFGELAPKRLAMQRALPWARVAARPLDMLSTLSRPVVWLLARSSDAVVRVLGGRPEAGAEELSPEELREIVTSHQGLNAEQRQIITGALEIHERRLREVLVPRGSVFALGQGEDVASARVRMAEAGHSRAPVTANGELDDVVGVVHWAALVTGRGGSVGSVMFEPLVLPDTARVSAVLREFKATRQQLAVVIDEHGAVDGIVTLEDLLEEIVGEIYDETDRDVLGVSRSEDGSYVLPGTFPVHDLVDLGVVTELPPGDYTTVAGLVLQQLGRVPETPGDTLRVPGWRLDVLRVERHAITQVRLAPDADGPGDAVVAEPTR
jgi:putative hemolysin